MCAHTICSLYLQKSNAALTKLFDCKILFARKGFFKVSFKQIEVFMQLKRLFICTHTRYIGYGQILCILLRFIINIYLICFSFMSELSLFLSLTTLGILYQSRNKIIIL